VKRILKWVTLVLCILIAIPALAILGIWGYYKSIVWTIPALKTSAVPGNLGELVNPFGHGRLFLLVRQRHARSNGAVSAWCAWRRIRHRF